MRNSVDITISNINSSEYTIHDCYNAFGQYLFIFVFFRETKCPMFLFSIQLQRFRFIGQRKIQIQLLEFAKNGKT